MNVNVNVNSDFHRLSSADDESMGFDRPSEAVEVEDIGWWQQQILIWNSVPRYRRMLWLTNFIQCILILYVYTYQELYVLYIFVAGIAIGFLALAIRQLQILLCIYSGLALVYAMYLSLSVADETQLAHWDHVVYHFSLAFFEFFTFALSGYTFYQYIRPFFIQPQHTKSPSTGVDGQDKSTSVLPNQVPPSSAPRSWFNTPQLRHVSPNGKLDDEYLTNSNSTVQSLRESSVNSAPYDSNPFLTPSYALAPSPLLNHHGRTGSRTPVEQQRMAENLRVSSHAQTTDQLASFTHYHHYIHEMEDDSPTVHRPLPRPVSQHSTPRPQAVR